MLLRAGTGFGAIPLSWLLQSSQSGADGENFPALAHCAKVPHRFDRAKSVIVLFMEGGPSYIDTFDPKPKFNEWAGQKLPPSFKPVILSMGEVDAPLFPSKRKWAQYGESGLWVSDWLPHTAECMDDIAVVRSCWTNGINHSGGVCQMNTGVTIAGRPSLGAWASYGLGTENQNMPAFVVLQDGKDEVVNGPRNWGSGFMPAVYQGVRLQSGKTPIPNLDNPDGVNSDQQRGKLDFLTQLNRQHAASRPQQTELDARIQAYELAFRMQASAPEAVDLSQETADTQSLYGIDQKETETFGRMCLLSRRLVERGVRFVQLYSGSGVKGGQAIGTTDEIGLHAVEDRLHVHDLHATVPASLGVDHMEMVYKHKGRPERATLNEGLVCKKLFG